MLRAALLCFSLCLGTGCSLLSRTRVEPLATSFQAPSNVAAYVVVSNGDEPVTNLTAGSFKIYENEQLLDAEAHALLLDKALAAYHHTLLLVDLSGTVSDAEPLGGAVGAFVDSVRAAQAVTVFAFDGSPSLRLVAEFPKAASATPVDLHGLFKLGKNDSSRNLNGAVLSGLKELEARLAAQSKPVKVGTLVVFTRGADLAGRVPEAEAERAVDEAVHDVMVIGVAEQGGRAVANLGKTAQVQAQGADSLGIAFENAALKLRDLYDQQYLLAYCSPARGGIRTLKLEVQFNNREGDEQRAHFSQDFDASGFGPGCRSDATPRFVPQLGRAQPGRATPKKNTGDASGASAPTPAPTAGDDDSVALPPNKPGYSH